QVLRGADPGGAVLDLAGRLLAGIDQLGEALPWRVGEHGDADDVVAVVADVGEGLDGMERQITALQRHEVAGARERADRVAVGLGASELGHADGRRCAGLVDDDDRLAELGLCSLGQHARRLVRAAARGPRHDQRDRLVGVLGPRRTGPAFSEADADGDSEKQPANAHGDVLPQFCMHRVHAEKSPTSRSFFTAASRSDETTIGSAWARAVTAGSFKPLAVSSVTTLSPRAMVP